MDFMSGAIEFHSMFSNSIEGIRHERTMDFEHRYFKMMIYVLNYNPT
jgi:hypothetical protein